MPKQTQRTSIEFSDRSVEVEITQLPGRRAILLLARLGRMLGPSIGSMAGKEMRPENMGALIGGVLQSLNDADFDAISKELLESARADLAGNGSMVPVLPALNGQYFIGEPAAILAMLAFALKVNFGSFGKGLQSIGAAWQAAESK